MIEPATAVPELEQRRRPRRWLKWLGRFAMLLAGLVAGAVVAELVFAHRDDGAFPHLNVYRADPVLGVRLEPGASQRIAFGGNPATSVRINADGYRGADWPAPSTDEIVVVGDSQVFGLGVEEGDTFSAKLAEAMHRPVINAGVPTYGPDEYRAVIAELLAARHPRTVVLALNMVNDLFEASHPNRTRHAVWDGWAVRKESAPDSVTEFPGRAWLYRRSHLFFALRSWWNKRDPIDERGFASEGGWQEIAASGADVQRERDQRAAKTEALTAAQVAARRDLQKKLRDADSTIDSAYYQVLDNEVFANYESLQAGKANPGDIIGDSLAEGSRPVIVTAEMIRQGVETRARLRKKLAEYAKSHRDKDARNLGTALATHDQAIGELSKIEVQKIEAALEPPLASYVKQVQQLVEAGGARLVVVILPIDVQVSADEWKKYDAKPASSGSAGARSDAERRVEVIDMVPTRVLNDELANASVALGVSALDAIAPLAAVEPGAFLDHDIHMTAKGHAALAAALAKVIAAPPPIVTKVAGLTPVPVPALWREAPEVIVTGSTAAGCETQMVREWLRVLCGHTPAGDDPTKVAVVKDDDHTALALTMPHQTSLVVPVLEGHEVTALFSWTDQTRLLRISWPAGAAKPTLAFDKGTPTGGRKRALDLEGYYGSNSEYESPVEQAICKCWYETYLLSPGMSASPDNFACSGAYGSADAACTKTYADQCVRMLECIWHDPASPPK